MPRLEKPPFTRSEPTRCVSQSLPSHAEGQGNILLHEGPPLLGAEGHRIDIVAWLRGLGSNDTHLSSEITMSMAKCCRS
jgi:hypothetical protein